MLYQDKKYFFQNKGYKILNKGIFTKLDALTKQNMKLIKQILIIILVASFGRIQAQNSEFENFLLGGQDDANLLMGAYMAPLLKGMGYGFNNGWYNTAAPHKTLGFDLTISFNNAIVPVADQSFVFNNGDYSQTRLLSGTSEILPTVAGNDSQATLENFITDPALPGGELVLGNYPTPDGIADDLQRFGINKVAIPSPIIQIGVGLYKGTDVKVRWLPTINQDNFKFKYFGIGGLHSISQWIPALKNMGFLDISAFVGYTKITAEYAIPEGNTISNVDGRTSFEVRTLTYQLLVSAHVSVITGYVGIGMDNFKTNVQLLGSFDVYPGVVPPLVDPISLEETGTGGFRTTMGLRLKFAIFTLHGDYTIREYNTFTFGLGFSFR